MQYCEATIQGIVLLTLYLLTQKWHTRRVNVPQLLLVVLVAFITGGNLLHLVQHVVSLLVQLLQVM